MASQQYFNFIGTVWNFLSEEDRQRLGETWHGYEQIISAIYQQYIEVNLNITVADLQAYATERWLDHRFPEERFVVRPAVITSNQDLSNGLNLTARYLLRFRIDGGAAIEVNLQGIIPGSTTINEIVSKINLAAGFAFARGIFDNTIVQLVSPTQGSGSSIEILPTSTPLANACEFVLGVDSDTVPEIFPKFRYPYTLGFANMVSIPELRDAVRDESVTLTLTEGVDYAVDRASQTIAFAVPPPPLLWAKRNLIDKETPWNNFGFLMGIYQQNSPRYVQIIQGLWFAFWNGPTPDNVQRALHLLFGLPAVQEDGVVKSVSATQIVTLGDDGTERTFEVPLGLHPDVVEGQRVGKLDHLVTGIEVFDKVNYPGFITKEIGRAGIERFLTEDATRGSGDTDETKALTMLEEYTFLPQISVEAFIYPDIDLGNVVEFLDAIKPLNKTYLFQVIIGEFQDPIELDDMLGLSPNIDLWSNLDGNETSWQSQAVLATYETSPNEGLDTDPEGVSFNERVAIEVYAAGLLIDSIAI